MGLLGSYLKEPITEKESTDESNDKLSVGVSCMQGWRINQEDAHNCILNYDTDTSFFAVYDGHGGHEVAQYCSQKLPDFIKSSTEYQENKIEEALTEGFLRFDASITTPEVIEVLKTIANGDNMSDASDEDEENINNLYEEATMPIEQVIEKYTFKEKKKDSDGESCSSKRKKDCDKTVGTSSTFCSSSSESQMQDKSGDAVSSSSEAAGTSIENKVESKEVNGPETSSENKVTEPNCSSSKSEVDSTLKEKKDETAVQNGEISTPSSEAQPKSDVTSSSTHVENGTPLTPSEKGKGKAVIKPEPVKTSTNTRPKRNAQQLYKDWLNCEDDSEDSSSSEEEEEEEDQSFEGPNEDSSGDDEEGVNIAIDASEDSSEDKDEEGEEESDEEDADDTYEDGHRHSIAWSEKVGVNSGCTAVVALLKGNELYVANAGDSRCIVCRNGKAIEMSEDHKPEDKPERDRIVKAGGTVDWDGRVDGGPNLSRAFGDHAFKQNKKLSDREQMITALPDIRRLTITPNEDEFMVLACDGIWNSMSNQEVVDFVRPRIQEDREKLSTICEEMFDSCLATDSLYDSAGCDNMTSLIVKFKSHTTATNKRALSPNCEKNCTKRAKSDDKSETQVDTTV